MAKIKLKMSRSGNCLNRPSWQEIGLAIMPQVNAREKAIGERPTATQDPIPF